jgi:hypothetical protein
MTRNVSAKKQEAVHEVILEAKKEGIEADDSDSDVSLPKFLSENTEASSFRGCSSE